MKIAVAGTGYVGLVTGVCMAHKGHNVSCIDVDESKIEMLRAGQAPIQERGLEELIRENRERLTFTTDYAAAYRDAEVIFICVGTPERFDGSANLNYVYQTARQIAGSVERSCVVALKSTVPIGSNDRIEAMIRASLVHPVEIELVSNPEFLSQGTAVRDTLHASRIVIGTSDPRAEAVMRTVYAGYDGVPVLVTDRRSAEMIKYASNDFLALKISYINEIANLCEQVGADIVNVAKGMGLDERIGNKFLNAGVGYGGSCFPKDTKALHWLSSYYDYELKTIKAAIEINEQQKIRLLKKARRYYASLEGRRVAVLGLTFKPGTDDLRDSPSLQNVPMLAEDGAKVAVWDPLGMERFKALGHEGVEYCASPEEALSGAELCLILTEWPQIAGIAPETFVSLMKRPVVLDGRNCMEPAAMRAAGALYEGIGRGSAPESVSLG